MIDGQVPWRCLVPADAVSFIIGKGGANIRELSETSGARVVVSKEGETPATLADKIVTISGLVEQKESACAQVLKKLRQMQGVNEHEPGVFVIIVPQISAPVIIGSKGAQIKSIMENSGAEINVGREAIIGMPDQPISINGTLDQVVSAVSKLNGVLQDMADRGKLMDKDFVFRSHEAGAAEAGMAVDMPPMHQTPPTEPEARMAMNDYTNGAMREAQASGPIPSMDVGAGMASGCGARFSQDGAANGPGSHSDVGAPVTANGASAGHPEVGMGHAVSAVQASGVRANGATSFGPGSATANGPSSDGGSVVSFGPSGQAMGAGQPGGQGSFMPSGASSFGHKAPSSFGPNSAASFVQSGGMGMCGMPNGPTSFGQSSGMGMGGMGMGGMGIDGMGMGAPMGMGGMSMGGMGMNGPMGMGMGMGLNSMGAMGSPMMGAMGAGNPMMGGIGGSSNERAFLVALQASGINSAQLTLLLPQSLVQNILVPRGIMAEIAQRSGSQIDLGSEGPPGMRQVSLKGSMVANALASLFLQEKAIQFQQMV